MDDVRGIGLLFWTPLAVVGERSVPLGEDRANSLARGEPDEPERVRRVAHETVEGGSIEGDIKTLLPLGLTPNDTAGGRP